MSETRSRGEVDGIVAPDPAGQHRAVIRVNVSAPTIRDDGAAQWMDVETLDLSLLNSGTAPLLRDHYRTLENTAGVIERAWIEGGSLYAIARFGNTQPCRDAWQIIVDRIINHVSLGFVLVETPHPVEGGAILAKHVRPFEISLTPVPRNWLTEIKAGPLPMGMIEAAAATEAAQACGTPQTWLAWASDAATVAAAVAANGPAAVQHAMQNAVEAELARLADNARAAFLAPFNVN
jgi:hypothetical protein